MMMEWIIMNCRNEHSHIPLHVDFLTTIPMCGHVGCLYKKQDVAIYDLHFSTLVHLKNQNQCHFHNDINRKSLHFQSLSLQKSTSNNRYFLHLKPKMTGVTTKLSVS